jgi:hypothetical protein
MFPQNVTLNNGKHFTFHYHTFNFSQTNPNLTFSIHFELHPLNRNLSYLFIYQFDDQPQFNSIDNWTLFCPSGQLHFLSLFLNHYQHLDLNDDENYVHFLDNDQTSNHQSIIYGIRELNEIEMNKFFRNKTFHQQNLSTINEPFHFTSDYEIRVYHSGCFYLDANNQWQSDGLIVSFPYSIFIFNVFLYIRLDQPQIIMKHNAYPHI